MVLTAEHEIHMEKSDLDTLDTAALHIPKPGVPNLIKQSNTPTFNFQVILKTIAGFFRCVWLGLEMNCAGQSVGRSRNVHPWPKPIQLHPLIPKPTPKPTQLHPSDLDPTPPPGSCVLQWGATGFFGAYPNLCDCRSRVWREIGSLLKY